ncbi:MAG: HNH endonuclease signature motif containing protein, partial [Actinomycetes bacterium]
VHADRALARSLDTELAATGAALAAGRVNRAQAEVIVKVLDDLAKCARWFEEDRAEHPDPTRDPASAPQLPDGLLEQAEAYLLLAARTEDARRLRVTGAQLLERVAPEVADEALGRRLAAEERAARARMRLVLRDNGDGTHSGSFTVPDLHAAMLSKALDALCSPRVTKSGEPGHYVDADGQRVPRAEQRGQAFCLFLERYPVDRLPANGGLDATVVVTLSWNALTDWYATAGLDTGGVVSAGEARRLMCSAGILPAVLGGASEVLDLGREQRLFSKAQRRAVNLRQPECTAAGCSRAAAQCEAHHLVPWSRGGPTDLAHAANLCPWHHHRAHDPRYDLRRHPDGSLSFHRRT